MEYTQANTKKKEMAGKMPRFAMDGRKGDKQGTTMKMPSSGGMKYKSNGVNSGKAGGMDYTENGKGSDKTKGMKPSQSNKKGSFTNNGIYTQNAK